MAWHLDALDDFVVFVALLCGVLPLVLLLRKNNSLKSNSGEVQIPLQKHGQVKKRRFKKTEGKEKSVVTPASVCTMSDNSLKSTAQRRVQIVHLSDTHSLHRTIESAFPLPQADVLVHTGDFTNEGTVAEFKDFNKWLGEIRSRYKHILVICGNHEYQSWMTEEETKRLLPNACVLNHESVELFGIRFFGSGWLPGQCSAEPGDDGQSHRFDDIPPGIDVLLTHCPAFGILDRFGGGREFTHWGGSESLRKAIERARPRAHLFGHLHEQRGYWLKTAGMSSSSFQSYEGRVEYEARPGKSHGTWREGPPLNYPCQLISCNAMKNHPRLEGRKSRIAGPPRLISAERRSEINDEGLCHWVFTLASAIGDS